MDTDVELGKGEGCETSPGCSGYSSMVHSKKVIKHALRQQAKRRRKNTTIAAGNSRTLPRIVVKPLPPPPPNDPPSPVNNVQHINTTTEEPAATMREVLASLPGFSVKSGRRRSTKRLSATAQLEAGLVDLESPASILASTSLRALLNRHTFQGLPPLYQRKLAQLLPAVDRQDAATSGLNNEFFARACLEWRKRLAEGEFTPENQQRLKMEAERDKNKLDPWKVKHFEPIWGEKREPKVRSGLHCMESRSGGAVTRSSLRLRLESNVDTHVSGTPCPIIISEVKVEQDNCKVETNSTDDLNEPAEIRELLPTEYNETRRTLIDETHPESVNVSSMETIPDVKMDRVKFEVDDKVVDLPAKQNTIEKNEVVAQVRQGTISNSYEQDMDLPRDKKTLEILEVNDKVIDLPVMENTIEESEAVAQIRQETIPNSYEEDMDLPRDKKDLEILETSKEDAILLPEENTSPTPSEQTERMSQASSQLSTDCSSQASVEHAAQIATEQMSQMSEEQIYSMSDCETTTILETSPSHEQVRSTDVVMEDSTLINDDRAEATQASRETPTDGESQIPEGMEIDSETLQRIHELEVRGEMREAYEEISGCPEEIIYPILDGMEMGSNNAEETETPVVPGQAEGISTRDQQDMNSGNEDEALREANNYVCSEMLECSWSVDPTVNNVSNNNRTQEDLQVPWPLVAALDGSVATNIPMPPQDECNETPTSTNSTNPPPPPPPPSSQQFINADSNVEPVNCIQLPVVQGTPFQSEGLAIGTPSTSCIMKNFQPQNSSLIAFPQLQPIGFVQTSFHSGQNTAPALSTTSPITSQVQTSQNASSQAIKTQEEGVQMNTQNNNPRPIRSNATQNQVPNTVPAAIGVQPQNRPQNAIVIQHQSPASTQPRQVVPAMQQQQYPGTTVALSTRSSRSTNQGNQRNSRSSNKDQGGGRSRSTTKEPPGAVNLERSYQICQAVIQSSPNRDQLKAHLKPPPSLLARGDGAFTTNKSGGRTITTVKTTKTSQTIQTKQIQNKTQSVMLRHVFATTRQATSAEIPESNTVAQLGSTTTGGLGQYILVQRTGVGDSAPRASSAPPLPPQIAGMGVGIHLVRGRPASAGEGSHQAVTLKARGADGRGGGGAEPGAPGMIMGGDPPPPCDCNMRGAMVICRQCGAFCHDDCIGPQRICATCLIR